MSLKKVVAALFLLIVAVAAWPAAASAEPSLLVTIDHNYVNGQDFPANTGLTLSVNGGVKGTLQTTTDNNGNFGESWSGASVPNQWLQPGDTLVVSDGVNPTVQMEIQNLHATADRAGDRVFGTAKSPGGAPLSGRMVSVEVYPLSGGYPPLKSANGITDATGAFDIALPDNFDLTLEHQVFVALWSASDGSASGHRTQRVAYNSVPSLGAMASQNWIQGNGFPPETAVTVSVNSGAKGSLPTVTDFNGNFFVSWWDAGDANHLLVGDTITATFTGGPATMQIQNVSAAVDLGTDIVTGRGQTPTGSALAGRKVRVGIYDPSNWSQLASAEATLNVSGYFTVDFTASHDLVRGEQIQVELWHASDGTMTGHRTFFDVYNAFPSLAVRIVDNWINGWGFPPNTSVTVSVNAGAKGSETAETDADGRLWVNWWPQGNANRIAAGDAVTAAYGTETHDMVIPNLQATADVDAESVTGTAFDGAQALDGRKVQVTIYSEDWSQQLANAETTVDVAGNFAFDLSPYDLAPGKHVDLTFYDAADGTSSGNQTYQEVYNGIPVLVAYVDRRYIRGTNFPPDTDLTIEVNAGAKGTDTVTTNSSGNFNSGDNEEYQQGLSAGDTITATFGTTVVQMVIQDVETELNIVADTVSVTARDPDTHEFLKDATVTVRINRNQQEPHAWLETVLDATGHFVFNFGVGSSSPWDIQRGDNVELTYTSPEGHQTVRHPAPIDITGTVRKDSGTGEGMPGVRVWVTQSSLTDTVAELSTDAQGAYTIKGLSPGPYKLFFDAGDYNVLNPDTNYLSEWHDNKASFETGDWIVISSTGAAQIIDAVLENTGGGIKGTVTGDAGPLEGIFVCPQSETWIGKGVNCAALVATDAAGKYSITGFLPGNYRILFYAGDYNQSNGGTDYANLWSGPETVVQGEILTVNAQLSAGGTISGTIIGEGDLPLQDIRAQFFAAGGLWVGEAGTDVNGFYAQQLTPGDYTVYFDAGEYNDVQDTDYVPAWYREPYATSASPVTAVDGGTTEGIGAKLEAGGRISGWVGAPGVGGLMGIQVKGYAAGDASTSVVETSTDASGQYMIRGVAPGSYKVFFDPALHNQVMSTDYLPEWYHNKPYFGAATILPIGVGTRRTVSAFLIPSDAGALFMVSPSAGTEWAQGSAQTIRWEGRVATGNVKILLYQGMTLKGTISASTPNSGSFDWMVPPLQAPGIYTVRVVWLANPTVMASSTFTIGETTGPITVTPPAAPAQGSLRSIGWSGIPQTGKVKILLYQSGVMKGTISASAPNTGSFDWVVPPLQAPGIYTVRVVWLLKPTVLGDSAAFTVVATAGPITVTPPAAPVAQGAKRSISWSGIPQTGKVKILLYQSGVMKGTISASAPNTGSFDWVVPPLQATGSYTVRVVWLPKPAVLGDSAPFTVVATAGPITVTPPAAPVAQGTVKTIAWSGIPQTGNVSIKLYQGLLLKGTVIASTANNGSFDWTVPATLAPGEHYLLLVTWLLKPAVTGTSAEFTVEETGGTFTVTPQLPFRQGEVRTIAWSGIPQTGSVSIKLYQESVLKGTVIASTLNDGSFDWTVPATLTSGVFYTLRVTWLSKPTIIGSSAPFKVIETTSADLSVKPLAAPVAQGTVRTISWGGIHDTGNVSIKLYQGSVLKGTVIASTPNDGSFDWIVPATLAPALPYTLRVTWLSKITVFAASAEFTVVETAGPLTVSLPAGGASVRQGAVQEVAWSGIPLTGNVKILLYQGTIMKGTISTSAPNNGSFTWIVPGTQALGAYTVRVVWLSKPAVLGESGQFTVIGP